MNSSRAMTITAFGLACLGLLVPAPLLHAASHESEQQPPEASTVDVALGAGGVLRGQVVNGQGVPLGNTPLSLRQIQGETATTATDSSGRFELAGLRGGTCQIVAGGSAAVCRLWSPNTAPPSAKPALLIVADSPQVLGRRGPVANWVTSHPWIVAGVVATAIAVPVAIHNLNNDDPVSP